MSVSRTLALVLAACALVAAVAIALIARPGTHVATPAGTTIGTPIDPPKAAHDFVLRDGAGKPAHMLVPGYASTFLFFGYTHCPDACPIALAALGRANRMLSPQEAARTRIVFVTIDPARDTPPIVARYVRRFDPHIVGLTGSRAELAPVWDAYGVRIDAKTHDISHGDTIYALDPSGRADLIYPPDTPAKDLAADMRALAR